MRVGFQETSQSKIPETQICVQNGGSMSTAQRTAERAAKMCPIKRFQLALATFNLCNAKMVKVRVTYLIWHAFGCKVWQKVHLGSQVFSSVLYLLWPKNKLALLTLLVPTRLNGSEKHNQGINESLDASWAWSKNDGKDQNIRILFLLSRWLFRVSDLGGKSTLGASESGDAPGLIAGASDFPPGREVRMGHLAYRKIGKVTEASSNFKFLMLMLMIDDEKKFRIIFLWCAFVGVFVVCPRLVWWGSRCSGHETEIYFWFCYAGCSLIVVLNLQHSALILLIICRIFLHPNPPSPSPICFLIVDLRLKGERILLRS